MQEKSGSEQAEDVVETLDSAGFAIAMQMCSDLSNCPLPRGAGFTGRWRDGELHAISSIQEKMYAAKRAGIVLLFACLGSDDALPASLPGLSVVVLPEGMELSAVIRVVNQICAESGLTEFRWKQALKPQMRSQPLSFTPNLPDAIFKPDPRNQERLVDVPFVGEKTRLAKLSALVSEAMARKRRMLFVVGAQRDGKTTLLSEFARRQPMYPCWFSFRAIPNGGDSRKQLATALTEQLNARYLVVSKSPIKSFSETFSAWTNSSPLIIVDGLDEAGKQESSGDDRTLADEGAEQSLTYLCRLDTQPKQSYTRASRSSAD